MTADCAFTGCDKPAYRRHGLCNGHRSQKARGQELRPLTHRPPVEGDCKFIGCDKPAKTRRLCAAHYNQLIRGQELRPLAPTGPRGLTCEYDGCDKPHYSRGLCAGHNSQRKRGQELRPLGMKQPKQPKPPRLPKPAAKKKQVKATPPPRIIDEGPKWIPGTLWPELERSEDNRPTAPSRNVDPATLLYTSVLIDDTTKAACRNTLARWDALDLADMLGVAS